MTTVSLRVKTALYRLVRPAFMIGRNQPTTWSVQRRSIASHRDVMCPQVSYEKDENVRVRKLGQFDLEGKVFVVTGTTAKVS
jgi:hypothetical protein